MKKFIYLMALIFAISSCDEKNVKESSIPSEATNFINTHFAGVKFSYAEREKDDGIITYDITLANGAELTFTESGDWISVDCKASLMPEGIIELIPAGISTYLSEKHIDSKIVSIEKAMGGYEIGINDYANELIFNGNGVFINYDIDTVD